MSSLALKKKALYRLEVLSGQNKGDSYHLIGSRISIGRSKKNDICLFYDENCSRQHAVLDVSSMGQIKISETSSRNRMKINGTSTKQGVLSDGDEVEVGDTKLVLKSNNSLEKPKFSTLNPTGEKSLKNFKPLLIAGGVFVLLFLFLGGEKAPKEPLQIRTEEQIINSVEENIKVSEELKKLKETKGHLSKEYSRAQGIFLTGFRDYKNHLYGKSIDYFHACLSIFPNHPLCQRYLILARKKLDEVIQSSMQKGLRHKENQQYESCYEEYFYAMTLIGNVNSKIYKEASSNADYCKFLMKDIF